MMTGRPAGVATLSGLATESNAVDGVAALKVTNPGGGRLDQDDQFDHRQDFRDHHRDIGGDRAIGRRGPSGSRHRLQALERQAFGILDAGEIKPADEGRDGIAIAVGQCNHGIDGDSLGLHGLPHVVVNLDRESVRLVD
jgi:hypothetical protein